MAAIGISEFTFGYAFLYEQTHASWQNLRAAPVLPSLQQEQDQGWDAHLPLVGTDFYYQFKLSDYLSRGNALFIADGTYTNPYYRLALHRRDNNRQHRRLREHVAINPNTFYVAPEFNTIDDFNAAYLSRQLSQRSRLIPLADCDDIDDGDQHYITFQAGEQSWLQHSERRIHERSFSGQDMENLYRSTEKQWRRLDKRFSEELFQRSAAIVRRVVEAEDRRAAGVALPLLDFNPHQADRREILLRTSQILSVTLGVTLVLVGAGQ
jgi:hypothetical protein